MSDPAPGIVVVGSINRDITVRVDRLPAPGETVLGKGHDTDHGGKGANQAAAAARLGRRVAMVGRVGDDAAGEELVGGLGADGVDTGFVVRDPGAGSGLALITLDAAGENTIVVSPGANATVVPSDVHAAASLFAGGATLLAQLEIPVRTVLAAARSCRGTMILNPAPAAELDDELLAAVDVLVPNETELAALAGLDPGQDLVSLAAAAGSVRGPGAVVVTLGSRGALVWRGGEAHLVPAPQVEAVDATAAGDAFCAALADGISSGLDLVDAARRAVAAGAVTVTRRGARRSLPTRTEVLEMADRVPPAEPVEVV